ncbi:DEAD/DEAH box helicase [Candidatus Falkowbacteria bacterium RIFOXYD2_FULL_35_9]|uniref:Type I restriction enzyme endonuclease subunit n=1 Tax=Candidatus Falkowbacteria bacterium RIFOXYC2_FULL_36_12 TaxID=1798002 RepID=A0A1F5T0V2_9BACT|nr:MAG: DEAD/DEAH box helicase [Candidatus Falkowbacteria bacterium RIFOXYC2_FULL_36_12]OGF45513.1 MAG: DEAD/DEAH box helicase [Candidatus Falkowbacteria bacterium RIFOXYD2_FULL_35_9]HIJ01959.1 type I restriction endonuclease subunit R [Candidatus Woesearchaeota archaeon]
MSHITESHIEEAALEILKEQGYKILSGPEIAVDGTTPERNSYQQVILLDRLKEAINRLNPTIPEEAKEDAVKKLTRTESPKLIVNNQRFHDFLVNGVPVEYRKDGRIKGDIVYLFDFKNPRNNEFVAVNQFTVIENNHNRRPDIVIFINGLPLAVIELKNPADENATIWSAYNQLQTYKEEISSLFNYNEILIISDGTEARAGTLTSEKEWFLPWKTIDGKEIAPKALPQLQVLLEGMFEKTRIIDMVRNFIVYQTTKKKITKIMAAYHQYHATNKAIESTIKATKKDRRAGVVWHTQGSGKSLTMVFYSGKLVLSEELENPTIVVLTDRNDLDDQLFNTFSSSQSVLRQKPIQTESREKLKENLSVSSGGIVFTTIQKFFPEKKGDKYPILSPRKNIVVIADEAHRSQYDFIDGFARHMRDALPNASFIGFTGTPIELSDKSTPAVFGHYIDVYDIEQAVIDGATVRIFYEGRLAKLELKESEKPKIDPEFEEVTEQEETAKKETLKSKWARLEAVIGSEKRVKVIAKDIVKHFEQREEAMEGKAMIVCMSRRICVDLFNAIKKLKPGWYNKDDDKGIIKVIMTGSASDPLGWQEHVRTKLKRRELGDRFKDSSDQFKIAIVRDMWLTGFDAPCLHTLYLDKPMRGHGLMQAIARVNRVFKDKPGGLIVDYLGVADELKKALANYTLSGGKGKPTFDQEDAVAVMLEKYEIVNNLFYKFDYKKFFSGTAKEKMIILPAAMEHVLKQKDGKERCLKYVTELSKAFALAVPHEEAIKIRDDVGFFQAVRSALAKATTEKGKPEDELNTAIKQIVSKAITSDEVIDIFKAAGLKKPDISILSDEFLAEIKGLEHKNLALETLKKLLNDEIKTRARRNIVEARAFSAMLEQTIKKYQNRSIEAAQVITELIDIAIEIRESKNRGEKLNLTEDELAFYDALVDNGSAKEVLGDETLKQIAKELTEKVKQNTSIDWTLRESVKSKLKVLVKRLLRKYGYPPDKQEKATELVLEQAELVSKNWVEQ